MKWVNFSWVTRAKPLLPGQFVISQSTLPSRLGKKLGPFLRNSLERYISRKPVMPLTWESVVELGIRIGLLISIPNTCGYHNCVCQQGLINVTACTSFYCILLSTRGITQNGGNAYQWPCVQGIVIPSVTIL